VVDLRMDHLRVYNSKRSVIVGGRGASGEGGGEVEKDEEEGMECMEASMST